MRRVSPVAVLAFSFLLPALAAGEPPGPSFRSVGDAPGGGFLSKAYGVSPNGRFVVGATEVETDKNEAFRWENGALETLGRVAELQVSCILASCDQGVVLTDSSSALAVSSNGSVVGRVCTPDTPFYLDLGPQCAAARFVGSTPVPLQPELHLLEGLYDWYRGAATALSADGSVVYGDYRLWEFSPYGDLGDQYGGIFRWQDSVPTVLASGGLVASSLPERVKVSPDGGAYAYRTMSAATWPEVVIHTFLHKLGEDTELGLDWASDVSELGLVVVGQSSSQAARWHGGSVTLLGDLPGGDEVSWALAVSDAGHVIAGWGKTIAGQEAFLWTAESGMQRLADVLTDHGLDLSGWTLEQATGLSASGRTIVGWGTNPSGDTEGFVATLPARVIPTPSLGRSGLALLAATLIAAASAAVRRGRRRNTSPATP
jgi:probable HAF family extracellular repeat protein